MISVIRHSAARILNHITFRYTFMTLTTGSTRLPKLTSRSLGHGTVTFSDDAYNDPDDEALREDTATMDGFLPTTPDVESPEDEGDEENE